MKNLLSIALLITAMSQPAFGMDKKRKIDEVQQQSKKQKYFPLLQKKLNNDLFSAIKHHKLDKVTKCLDSGASVIETNKEGLTALEYAVRIGALYTDKTISTGIIRTLIKHGAPLDAEDNAGWTPLHFAAIYNSLELAQCMLKTIISARSWPTRKVLLVGYMQKDCVIQKLPKDILKHVFSYLDTKDTIKKLLEYPDNNGKIPLEHLEDLIISSVNTKKVPRALQEFFDPKNIDQTYANLLK